MELTREEERALQGEYGDGLKLAYKILVSIGNANDATKLIPIKWAHISGVNFNTIGEAGVRFLSELDKETKVTVTTTLNPMGFDSKKDNNISEDFKANQHSIINSYLSLGVIPSFTCIPYEIFTLPKKGEIVSFAESNAAVFINSILGIKTNKESSLSSLASAITGKTPYSDLLIDDLRTPTTSIKPDIDIQTESDFGLLGYFAGKIAKDICVGLEEINLLGHLTERKKFKKPCVIFCPRSLTECNNKMIRKLKKAGADINCDSCTCLTPLITKNDYDSIVTNSIKCAYYMKHANKIDVSLKDMKSITKEYCE